MFPIIYITANFGVTHQHIGTRNTNIGELNPSIINTIAALHNDTKYKLYAQLLVFEFYHLHSDITNINTGT
jgi:hypothetical protein